jgi:dienelactone hydrolase
VSDPGGPCVVAVRAEGDDPGDRLAAIADRVSHPWRQVAVPAGGTDALRAGLDGVAATAIAVVASGGAAGAAIDAASYDPRVVAVCAVGGPVPLTAARVFELWKDVPVLAVVEARDRDALGAAVELRFASTHPDSDIEVIGDVDVGTGPTFGSLADAWTDASSAAASWLDRRLAAVAERREVIVHSDDGWEIHGTLTVPSGDGSAVPAAVLLHSGRSDRAVFSRLQGLLARHGVAALSIDWRGRGQSQNQGTYFTLTAEQRAEGWRDARAALSALEEHPGIDASRVAMIGVVHGAEHAVAASLDDDRVKMLGLLTGYAPRSEREAAHLVSGAVDVLYVTCRGHGPTTAAMRELAARTPAGKATLRVYSGGAIGYQLFAVDPALEEAIASWAAAGLGATTEVTA